MNRLGDAFRIGKAIAPFLAQEVGQLLDIHLADVIEAPRLKQQFENGMSEDRTVHLLGKGTAFVKQVLEKILFLTG
ncbi:hypothetical protein AZI98_17855 [Aeribacillus pallidus]|uniref:Uncharacterized protein n=1 Tax=Aeribacillus pallidus TaxID=33936 RepID=A0A167YYX8_9BACI|nr:hypothetical protein AZI98_17855 [Aeribacillus pallidus]